MMKNPIFDPENGGVNLSTSKYGMSNIIVTTNSGLDPQTPSSFLSLKYYLQPFCISYHREWNVFNNQNL